LYCCVHFSLCEIMSPEGNSWLSTGTAMMVREPSFFVLTYKTGYYNVFRYWVGVMEVAFLKAV
jgi:hypothetical protein